MSMSSGKQASWLTIPDTKTLSPHHSRGTIITMARRLLPALALLAAAMVAGIAAAGDLDTLAGTAGGQPGQQGQGAGAAGTAAEQVGGGLCNMVGTVDAHGPGLTCHQSTPAQIQASQEAAQALQSVEPTNLNPLLGSFLIPQWRDDKKPDLWVGQGQLFLKNQDPARALCSVVYTIRINFAQVCDGGLGLGWVGLELRT